MVCKRFSVVFECFWVAWRLSCGDLQFFEREWSYYLPKSVYICITIL